MRTIQTVLQQLTSADLILQDMKETLRTIDPEFPEQEDSFRKASEALEEALGDTISPSVRDFLAALESNFAAAITYFGWQGFMLNLDIFHNPVHALLLKEDHEDLRRERRLHTIPAAKMARQTIDAFYEALRTQPEEIFALVNDISEYYAYLETAGYTLAHYFGFRLADSFLPYVVPGYTDDSVNTALYTMIVRKNLNVNLELIN